MTRFTRLILAGAVLSLASIAARANVVGDIATCASATVSNVYNGVKLAVSDAQTATKFVVNHSECLPPLVSGDPVFIATTAGVTVLINGPAGPTKLPNDYQGCANATSGLSGKIIMALLKAVPIDAPELKKVVAQEGDAQAAQALQQIPVVNQILGDLTCGCAVSTSGAPIEHIKAVAKSIEDEVKGCGSVLGDVAQVPLAIAEGAFKGLESLVSTAMCDITEVTQQTSGLDGPSKTAFYNNYWAPKYETGILVATQGEPAWTTTIDGMWHGCLDEYGAHGVCEKHATPICNYMRSNVFTPYVQAVAAQRVATKLLATKLTAALPGWSADATPKCDTLNGYGAKAVAQCQGMVSGMYQASGAGAIMTARGNNMLAVHKWDVDGALTDLRTTAQFDAGRRVAGMAAQLKSALAMRTTIAQGVTQSKQVATAPFIATCWPKDAACATAIGTRYDACQQQLGKLLAPPDVPSGIRDKARANSAKAQTQCENDYRLAADASVQKGIVATQHLLADYVKLSKLAFASAWLTRCSADTKCELELYAQYVQCRAGTASCDKSYQTIVDATLLRIAVKAPVGKGTTTVAWGAPPAPGNATAAKDATKSAVKMDPVLTPCTVLQHRDPATRRCEPQTPVRRW